MGMSVFLWMCDDVYATRNTVFSPPATYLHFLLPALFSAPILLAHISKEFNTHKMQQKWYSRKESSNWIDINSEGDSLTSLKVLWNSQARIPFILVFLSDDKTVQIMILTHYSLFLGKKILMTLKPGINNKNIR